MCRKCIKNDVCHFKFAIGTQVQQVLKEKDEKPPEGMVKGKAVSLQDFEDVMDVVQQKCQFYLPYPEEKMVELFGDIQ